MFYDLKFRVLAGMVLCCATCEPVADTDLIAVAYTGQSIPARARVVFRAEYPVAGGGQSALLGVVQSGGSERLVVVGRARDAGAGETRWLALEFSAPRVIGSPIARELPPGLALARSFYTGDALSAVRRVALVRQIGRAGDVADTLFVEYAREEQAGYFLYTPSKSGTGFERSYDSLSRALPANSFLYFNGFETVACEQVGGACPAIEFSGPPGPLAGPPGPGVSIALRIRNLAPNPASFYIALAAADPHSRLSVQSADTRAGRCESSPGLIRCRIETDVALTLQVSNVTVHTPPLVRLAAGSSTGRALAPPEFSLRRTIDGPHGARMYLVNFSRR